MTAYIETLQKRYTTKIFDPTRTLSADEVQAIKTILRLSPSSTNSQPWHFMIATTREGKDRIAQATQGFYQFNEAKVKNASAVVVLCTRTDIDKAYTDMITTQEEKDGRYPNDEVKETVRGGREFFANLHRDQIKDAPHWMEKQTFIALGNLLVGVAHLGLHACPMEGFDYEVMSETLGLKAKGLAPTVIVSLGISAENDFNAGAPKSRLPEEVLFTEL